MIDYRLVDKIVSLQRMAEPAGGATPAEQELAAMHAKRLMDKHGVTQNTVDVRRRLNEVPRRGFSSPPPRPGPSRTTYKYKVNAALFADLHGLNAVKFRSWLRKEGIVGARRDQLLEEDAEGIVARFNSR